MRTFVFICLVGLLYCVCEKGEATALTESLGSEIIEIGNPVKDLPPDIEEEPSAEEDYKQLTAATKKPANKTTATLQAQSKRSRKTNKDIDVSDEEDAKVERELNAMYKDSNTDYKDSKDTRSGTTYNSETETTAAPTEDNK